MEWPLLASLGADDRSAFLALARPRTLHAGEVVCRAGEPADSLHLVTRGRLSVHVSLASGSSVMLNVLKPGDYFGELALLTAAGRRTATITALEPAETRVVTGRAFNRLCRDRPSVERTLAVLLAHRVDELSQQLLEALHAGLEERVGRRLLELTAVYADGDGPVVVPLTQSQLAEMTGGTRPSVNLALQRLVEQGLVALGRGRIRVPDPDRLRRVLEG